MSDDMARAFVAAWREKFPGSGFPALTDAKELLSAALGRYAAEINDLQETVLACKTLDDLRATQLTILAIRALPI